MFQQIEIYPDEYELPKITTFDYKINPIEFEKDNNSVLISPNEFLDNFLWFTNDTDADEFTSASTSFRLSLITYRDILSEDIRFSEHFMHFPPDK